MKEFLLIFRRDNPQSGNQPSPEQMQALMKQWQDWMGGLAAQNKMVAPGTRLGWEGNVVRTDRSVTNGPFVEIKEVLSGYMLVRAENLDEATELAKGCPILRIGGNVEVRPILEMV